MAKKDSAQVKKPTDSWKKLGVDLAKEAAYLTLDGRSAQKAWWLPVWKTHHLVLRARALRRAALKKEKAK